MSLGSFAVIVSTAGLVLFTQGCGAAAGPVSEHDDVVVVASGESVPGCVATTGCTAGRYCATAVAGCSETGSCEDSPRVCPELVRPVCGCDGATYDNECFAQQAGISVDHEGACLQGG